jgi:hypothetical protein
MHLGNTNFVHNRSGYCCDTGKRSYSVLRGACDMNAPRPQWHSFPPRPHRAIPESPVPINYQEMIYAGFPPASCAPSPAALAPPRAPRDLVGPPLPNAGALLGPLKNPPLPRPNDLPEPGFRANLTVEVWPLRTIPFSRVAVTARV